VYPEQNIGTGNMVIFDIFMVAKFVELLTVRLVFSLFVCVLHRSINCDHFVYFEK